MATNRIRRRAEERVDLKPEQEMYLIDGWCIDTYGKFPFKDELEARTLWFKHRKRLLAIEYNGFQQVERKSVGRPWAWWAFESPGPRRRKKGRPEYDYEAYESELTFLKRHSLLTEAEQASLLQGKT